MTCIVAISDETKGLYFGADSAVSGEDILQTAIPKVFSKNGVIIGVCGDYATLCNLTYNLNLEEPNQDLHKIIGAIKSCTQDPLSVPSTLLVGFGSSLYQIDLKACTPTPTTPTPMQPWGDYHAVGSGRELALGSLFTTEGLDPLERLKIALRAATSPYVREPFILCHLPFGYKTPIWETYNVTQQQSPPPLSSLIIEQRQPSTPPFFDIKPEMSEGLFKNTLASRYRLQTVKNV